MPATISVNFTNQTEVQGSNPPNSKSVSAKVLRDVLDAGQISGGYVTLAGTQTITGAKTFSNTIIGSINGNSATVTNGVYTTGNQTIEGTKTFSGNLNVTGTSTGIIPVGAVMGFFTSTAPSGWLQLNGSGNISKTQYAALWAHAQASGNIVTEEQWIANQRYGSFTFGDATNFRIPFTEGFFLRGFSFGNVWDAGRAIGSYQGDGVAAHTHTYNDYYQRTNRTLSTGSQGLELNSGGARNIPIAISETALSTARSTTGTTGSVADTRPKNVPILYCIKF